MFYIIHYIIYYLGDYCKKKETKQAENILKHTAGVRFKDYIRKNTQHITGA